MKIKGVNLGGWLVLEKWMAPQVFRGTQADDEYYLAQDLPNDIYQDRIAGHRLEFISERDFVEIAARGFNMVRIPVPYFIFGDRPPFIGCIDELDRAFTWAEHYDLKILIDLHTVPDSQNGFDNGGISGVCKWAQEPEEIDFALTVLERLSQRYGQRSGLFGIEVLNEPIGKKMWKTMDVPNRYPARDPQKAAGSQPISLSFLSDFYLKAYQRISINLAADKIVVFHDGFELNAWEDFFKQHRFNNVMLDTHQYLMTAEADGITQTVDSYIAYIQKLKSQITEVQKYVPVFVGEWTLFNSYAVGTDTQGGRNALQVDFNHSHKLTASELREVYQTLWQTQTEAWDEGVGYFYWTYKLLIDTVNDSGWYGWDSWDVSRAFNKGWITKNKEI